MVPSEYFNIYFDRIKIVIYCICILRILSYMPYKLVLIKSLLSNPLTQLNQT